MAFGQLDIRENHTFWQRTGISDFALQPKVNDHQMGVFQYLVQTTAHPPSALVRRISAIEDGKLIAQYGQKNGLLLIIKSLQKVKNGSMF